MVGAAASGLLGWQFGYVSVFLLAALFGAITSSHAIGIGMT